MQKWILYACAVLIITSIFHMLTPEGSVKQIMRFVLNLFLISLILMPIFKNISSAQIQTYLNSPLTNPSNKEQLKLQQNKNNVKNLENALTILLKSKGFKNFKINLNPSEKNNQTEINLIFPKNEKIDKNQIIKLIKNETGITPQITTIES